MQTGANLTQRRRQATQHEIARAAAELFARQGVAATSAEQIAAAAGVSLRTFYRHARVKQEAVVPLLAHGVVHWHERLARLGTVDAGLSEGELVRALGEVVVDALAVVDPPDGSGQQLTRGLVRTVLEDADLRRVWDQVNGESERSLVPILSTHAPDLEATRLRVLAAAATAAIRIALEQWADDGAPAQAPPSAVAAGIYAQLATPLA